ncbi:MAG: hypothetical protein GF334_10875 [Candidatus Altiarchaeales archaeon]|nr:hypothetical protein [Candidatus Altiarchaeales archaeon]
MTEKRRKYRTPGTSNDNTMKVDLKELPKDPKHDVPGTSNHPKHDVPGTSNHETKRKQNKK